MDRPSCPSLPGFEWPESTARPTDRLFFATYPDTDAQTRISRLARDVKRQHGMSGKPISRERLHVTLAFLGNFTDFPEHLTFQAAAGAATVSMPVFTVAFDHVASFGTSGPLVLLGGDGVVGLSMLHERLSAALAPHGFTSGLSFMPHVTLLYDGLRIDPQPVEPIVWTVRDFVLVRSMIGQSRHIPLGSWPLRE